VLPHLHEIFPAAALLAIQGGWQHGLFPTIYDGIFAAFAFMLGASIGSFLNVCIYRMPRDLSVNEPKRSFCPSCKYQIPFHHNIPLVSWLVLRGRCANCGSRISFRYFGVELLTGLLFLAIWLKVWAWGTPGWHYAWILAFPYWIMAALFVVATFIDFEHFIIPDEITIGGAIAGILLSFAIPMLQGQASNVASGLWSIVGAVAGYGILWLVVELGKKAFGKKQFRPAAAMEFTWIRRLVPAAEGQEPESDADLVVGDVSWKQQPPPPFGRALLDLFRSMLAAFKIVKPKAEEQGESWVWSETFSRDSDRLVMSCPWVEVDGKRFENVTLVFSHAQLTIGDRKWDLEKVDAIKGALDSLHAPREAMGLGDVKFIAGIGAFLGWKAVLFTIMSASTVGAIVGVITIAIGRREWSARIPFGPYLALGALLWFFAGPELIEWYWRLTLPANG
jgi:leader peptidase (prepilin peptidase)/N-methyltransferase